MSKNQIDGEFFMKFEDFLNFYTNIDFINVDLNAFENRTNKSFKWNVETFKGSWIPGKNSGGCGLDPKLYWTNPQFYFKTDLKNNVDDTVSVIISLSQTDTNRKMIENGGKYSDAIDPLGVSIFKIKNASENPNRVNYKAGDLKNVYMTYSYKKERQMTKRLDLPPGDYVIIPSIFKDNVQNGFVLRVFMEANLSENQNTIPEDNQVVIDSSYVDNNLISKTEIIDKTEKTEKKTSICIVI